LDQEKLNVDGAPSPSAIRSAPSGARIVCTSENIEREQQEKGHGVDLALAGPSAAPNAGRAILGDHGTSGAKVLASTAAEKDREELAWLPSNKRVSRPTLSRGERCRIFFRADESRRKARKA